MANNTKSRKLISWSSCKLWQDTYSKVDLCPPFNLDTQAQTKITNLQVALSQRWAARRREIHPGGRFPPRSRCTTACNTKGRESVWWTPQSDASSQVSPLAVQQANPTHGHAKLLGNDAFEVRHGMMPAQTHREGAARSRVDVEGHLGCGRRVSPAARRGAFH